MKMNEGITIRKNASIFLKISSQPILYGCVWRGGGLRGQGNILLMFYTFRRRDCLHKFMVVLCERGETRRLIEYPFINLQDEVLDT